MTFSQLVREAHTKHHGKVLEICISRILGWDTCHVVLHVLQLNLLHLLLYENATKFVFYVSGRIVERRLGWNLVFKKLKLWVTREFLIKLLTWGWSNFRWNPSRNVAWPRCRGMCAFHKWSEHDNNNNNNDFIRSFFVHELCSMIWKHPLSSSFY